ncbi:GFA family protein [Cucumibacter marinus]|uniref:GFA family protein n=1 Tax=Cucumibacter marinus TaxID=1121252 RepID=UPI00138B0755|nr:GFA family protein [Cucumibacter marinus]
MSEERRTGACLCGAVTFTACGEPVIVANCHCTVCQRVTGAGHSTGAMYPLDQLELTGTTSEFDVEGASGATVTRTFCPACGSPIHGRNTGMPGFVTISLGLFDDPGSFTPEVTVFARDRIRWDQLDPNTESFETQPDWKPDS